MKLVRSEVTPIFLHKDELINLLSDRCQNQLSRAVFDRLNDFVANRVAAEYSSKSLFFILYNYLVEMYRKLNIKNTMSITFTRIKEIRN